MTIMTSSFSKDRASQQVVISDGQGKSMRLSFRLQRAQYIREFPRSQPIPSPSAGAQWYVQQARKTVTGSGEDSVNTAAGHKHPYLIVFPIPTLQEK